jgi:non-ribosomal peptide synthetase component F
MKTSISQNLASVSTRFETEKAYWLEQLAGELIKSHFPYDFVKPGTAGQAADRREIAIQAPGTLCEALRRLTNGSPYNLYTILAAVLNLLLERYTGCRDILAAAPIYKQPVDGEFINTVLILRTRLSGGMTGKQLLMRVKKTVVDANKHSNYPIGKLLYLLDMSNYEDTSDLFETVILLRDIHDPAYIKDLHYNVLFSFCQGDGTIEGTLSYNPLLYRTETMERIGRHFLRLLRQLTGRLDEPVENLEMLEDDERQRLLQQFNQTEAQYPSDRTIRQLFEEQAAKTPDHLALAAPVPGGPFQPGSLQNIQYFSYGHLEEQANRLAGRLRRKGIQPGATAAIMVEPSPAMIVGILGILKSGAAYVPIDTDFPPAQTRHILADSKTSWLLTRKAAVEFYELDFQGEVIDLDERALVRVPTE